MRSFRKPSVRPDSWRVSGAVGASGNPAPSHSSTDWFRIAALAMGVNLVSCQLSVVRCPWLVALATDHGRLTTDEWLFPHPDDVEGDAHAQAAHLDHPAAAAQAAFDGAVELAPTPALGEHRRRRRGRDRRRRRGADVEAEEEEEHEERAADGEG